jgi:hypothetical protein
MSGSEEIDKLCGIDNGQLKHWLALAVLRQVAMRETLERN